MESSKRNQRKVLQGTVTSRMGNKSVKVTVPYKARHPRYLKVINRKTVLHVHDEANEANVGDRVEIMETRPLSRLKRWRITRIIERAPEPAGSVTPVEVEEQGEVEAGAENA
ncbi:MAG: 30S ribosomal protein S17 [Verrucomicrobia bacterium]|nr:MAG: 30S ribosomal protein S17 [Verrucomicrobiota bacterium]